MVQASRVTVMSSVCLERTLLPGTENAGRERSGVGVRKEGEIV